GSGRDGAGFQDRPAAQSCRAFRQFAICFRVVGLAHLIASHDASSCYRKPRVCPVGLARGNAGSGARTDTRPLSSWHAPGRAPTAIRDVGDEHVSQPIRWSSFDTVDDIVDAFDDLAPLILRECSLRHIDFGDWHTELLCNIHSDTMPRNAMYVN